MGGARTADGSSLVAQGLLDRLPSVLCKAVAIDLSAAAAQALSRQAVDIGLRARCLQAPEGAGGRAGRPVLAGSSGVQPDARLCNPHGMTAIMQADQRGKWQREPGLRTPT